MAATAALAAMVGLVTTAQMVPMEPRPIPMAVMDKPAATAAMAALEGSEVWLLAQARLAAMPLAVMAALVVRAAPAAMAQPVVPSIRMVATAVAAAMAALPALAESVPVSLLQARMDMTVTAAEAAMAGPVTPRQCPERMAATAVTAVSAVRHSARDLLATAGMPAVAGTEQMAPMASMALPPVKPAAMAAMAAMAATAVSAGQAV